MFATLKTFYLCGKRILTFFLKTFVANAWKCYAMPLPIDSESNLQHHKRKSFLHDAPDLALKLDTRIRNQTQQINYIRRVCELLPRTYIPRT